MFMHRNTACYTWIIGLTSLFAINFFFSAYTHAQGRNEEVTIIAPYKPSISDAFKINMNPKIEFEDSKLPPLEYSITPVKEPTTITPEPVEATHKPYEPYKSLKRNFVRAGFGNYTTPYFEFFANSRQSDEHALGVHLRHLSSSGEIKDYANSSYSQNNASVFGKKYFDNHVLGGKLFYDRDVVHYYGYKPDDFPNISLSSDDIRHRLQTFGANASFKSTFSDDDAFNHHTGIRYNFTSDNYETTEHNVLFTAGFDKRFEWFDITEYQTAGLDADVDYFINDDSVSSYSCGLITARPFLSTDFDQYRIYLGAKMTFRADSASGFHFYPVARVEVDFIQDVLTGYASIGGGMQRASYRSLSDENPFILPIVPLAYVNEQFQFSAGILGNISEKVNFHIMAENTTVKDLPLFVNDTNNQLNNTFTVLYDNANVFHFKAALSANTSESLRMNIYAEIFNYSMKNEEKAWHRPGLKAGAHAWYSIRKKFILGGGIVFTGPMYARTFDDKNEVKKEQIDAWADLNLSFEYRITGTLSAFLNLNNLLNNGYMKWYNYPVQQFNVLGGIGFGF